MFPGAKVPGSESSLESSWNFRSRERKFLGAKVLGTFAPSEISIPWYFRFRERKFLGAKVPVTS